MYKRGCCLRLAVLFTALFFLSSPFAHAHSRISEWRVCFYNFAGINEPTLASMQVELSELFYPGRVYLEQAPCLPASDRVIYLILREDGPLHDRSALGRAAVTKDRVIPMLEVFVGPLVSFIGHARSAAKVGRALARVTAHEVTHFVRQDPGHVHYGLMRNSFSGRELAEDDSYPFLRR